MATIVDALLITLGLDFRPFVQGRKKAGEEVGKFRKDTETDLKKVDAANAKAGEGFKKVAKSVFELYAVFTAGRGLKEFIKDQVTSAAATGRLAKNLNMQTEALSAWQGVLKQNGGTADDANASLQALVSTFEQIQLTGQSASIPYLNALGIGLKDLHDPAETMLKLADKFSHMDPAQAQFMGAQLGLTPGMINTLEKGRPAVERMLKAQREAGVVTKKEADEAIRAQKAWELLIASSAKMGRQLLTDALPILEKLVGFLTKIAEWAQRHPTVVRAAFAAMAAAALLLGINAAGATLSVLGLVGAAAVAELPLTLAIAALSAGLAVVLPQLSEAYDRMQKLHPNGPVDVHGTPLKDKGPAGRIVAGLVNAWNFATGRHDLMGPEVKASGGKGGAAAGVTGGKPSLRMIRDYLVQSGLDPKAAEGIAAGIFAESGGDPNAVNKKSGAFGLGQWLSKDRVNRLHQMYGDRPSWTQQLDFILWEMSHSERSAGDAVKGAGSREAALSAYVLRYMRPDRKGHPGEGSTGDIRRGSHALAALDAARGGSGAPQVVQNTTHVDKVEVHTAATDARGIARDIAPALRDAVLAQQANGGLS